MILPPNLERLKREARNTDYYRIAMQWRALGFACTPSKEGLSKQPKWSGWATAYESELPSEEQITNWALATPDALPLLITGGYEDLRLFVVDVDNPQFLDWALDTFGRTPYIVKSPRLPGGGYHLMYRQQQGDDLHSTCGTVGPPSATKIEDGKRLDWEILPNRIRFFNGQSSIDLKGWHSYVVAPGSLHKSGGRYTPVGFKVADIDREFLESLPFIDPEVILREKEKRRTWLLKFRQGIREAAMPQQAELVAALPPLEREKLVSLSTTEAKEEPFIQWCRDYPDDVNFQLWWGLATNLFDFYGNAQGCRLFHEISRLSPSKYESASCDATWSKVTGAARGRGTSYKWLAHNDYDGLIPSQASSPAGFLRWKENDIPSGVFTLNSLGKAQPVISAAPAPISPAPRTKADHAGQIELHKHLVKVLSPELADVAIDVMRKGKEYAKTVREIWKAEGFTKRGFKCGTVHQGLLHKNTSDVLAYTRPCRDAACYEHGPLFLGRRIAAIYSSPMVDATGKPEGLALSRRTVFAAEVKESDFRAYRVKLVRLEKHWAQVNANLHVGVTPTNVPLPGIKTMSCYDTGKRHIFGTQPCIHGWVAFGDGAGKLVVLSTIRTKDSVPVIPELLEEGLKLLGLWAFNPLLIEEAFPGTGSGVHHFTGTLRTSRSICIDPAAFVAAANPSSYKLAVKRAVNPQRALSRLQAMKIYPHVREESIDGLATLISAGCFPEKKQRDEVLWAISADNMIDETTITPKETPMKPTVTLAPGIPTITVRRRLESIGKDADDRLRDVRLDGVPATPESFDQLPKATQLLVIETLRKTFPHLDPGIMQLINWVHNEGAKIIPINRPGHSG